MTAIFGGIDGPSRHDGVGPATCESDLDDLDESIANPDFRTFGVILPRVARIAVRS